MLQLDVSQGLALTVLALIAVLPEYAVDFTFVWKAGENPEKYAPLALAKHDRVEPVADRHRVVDGRAARGVAHDARGRKRGYTGELDTDVHLERPHAIEIAFLAIATLYSLTLPFKSTLHPVRRGDPHLDLHRVRDPHRPIAVGRAAPCRPPRVIGRAAGGAATYGRRHPARVRGAGDFVCAEPFAESLVHLGEQAGIGTFLLVQWLAPLASEAPELIIAGMFAWRLNTSAGFGTLLSSKVNQWTLLVGSLPLVYAISSNTLHGLPLDSLQREELFLYCPRSRCSRSRCS